MKALLLILVPGCVFAGELKTLKLDFKEGEAADYAAQIQNRFTKLLDSDPELAKEFRQFESPPPENARGRYRGEPTIQTLTLSETEHVDFRASGGSGGFEKTIALYYRFDEGFHRGQESRSGFFALFVVTGSLTYRNVGEDFELADSTIVATFKGFSRTLTAPKPID